MTTTLSISSTAGDAQPLKGVRAVLSTHLSLSAHSQLQAGAISIEPPSHPRGSQTAFYLKQALW